MLIDTHTHLDDARYESDREAMLARARAAGVESMITIGCDLATSRSAVTLANQYPFVYASIGVHPHEVKHIEDGWYDEFRRLARGKKVAKDAIELGFYLSFSGILTFQNATMLREIAKTVPADRLLIETDCPYLTPVPHRGKRNEPAFVRHVAELLATITADNVPSTAEDVARRTSENARRLFKIP